jgi:amino acid adenylation domain-containing protein
LFPQRHETETFERVRSGLPLSPNEERYVLSEAISAEAYGNPWSLRIRGCLDEARLRDAIQRMCDRHEGRRTGFEASGEGHFTRYVEARGRPSVRWLQMPGAPIAEVRRTIRAWFFERGDLSPPSFTKILVIQLADDEFVLANYFHHATSDAETHRAALSEIFDTYAGAVPQGEPVQYSDLWDWDWAAAPAYSEAEAFWIDQLGGADEIGALAEDGGDAGGAAWTGPVDRRLPAELSDAARQAAAEIGVSEFTFHYAVALVLLTRLAGQPRVCTTFQSRGRPKTGAADGVHGVFSNALILATEVDETQSIAELAHRLRGEIRMALTHEAYPYHHVIKATGAHPRFGVNWFPELPSFHVPGLEIERPEMSYGNWEYDLNIRFVRHEAADALDVVIYFREHAFRRERVVAAADQYVALLAAFARDVRAPIAGTTSADLAPVGLLPDLSKPLPSGGGEPIPAPFLRQAAQTPEAACVTHAGVTYSYGEVERRSRALAGQLLAAGVRPGDRVAVMAERRPELVWTLLAIARLGGIFVVLDSAYPPVRLEALIKIAAPRALVPAGGVEATHLARRLGRDAAVQVIEPTEDEAGETPGLDAASADDPAYILFTSGSTGGPKGVACSHAPLSRFTAWQATEFGLQASDRFSLLAGLSHDPLLRDIFTALGLGAVIAIPDERSVIEPGALARWFREAGVTVAHITPALGQVLLAGAAKVRSLPDLRRLFWGGDLLPTDLVREMAGFAPNAEQANFYGATETPQAVAVFRDAAAAGGRNVPIGRGVNGAQLLVVDPKGRLVGVGEAGEVAVRSNYLSLGYVDAGRIVPPGDRAEGGRIYRTGDRGFYLPDGEVLVLGRSDDQVKVRGYRVELAEITAALKAQAGVGQAATLAMGEGSALRIVAFATPANGAPPREAELTAGLAARLPAYMLPRTVRVLERLPLLPNGKLDRQALHALALSDQPEAASTADPTGASPTERALIARWSGVLGDTAISRATTFAGLGGDSLSYVQAYLATEEVIGVVPSGWQAMTIAELCAAKREASRFWSVVDTPMLVRAISIVVIVMGHLGIWAYGGGATAGLMIVFGFLFGAFQLTESFGGRTAEPILKGLRRLLLPVVLFSATLFAVKTAIGKSPDLSVLLLYGNFVDYSKLSSPSWGGHEFYLWFIYCSIQMMALIWLAALAALRFGGAQVTAVRFTLAMFALGCVGRFVAPALFIPDFFTHGAPHFTPVNYLPTTHLSTVMLGAFIAMAHTNRARLGVLALLMGYAGLTAWFYGPYGAGVIVAAGVLILAVKRLPLPRLLTALVLTLSGASLFIYLTHFQFRSVLLRLGAPDVPALHLAVALVGGVLAWAAWIRVSAWASRLLRRAPSVEPQAVI